MAGLDPHTYVDYLLGNDAIDGLRAVGQLRRMITEHEARHVRAARREGFAWHVIGPAMGTRGQTPHKRWAALLRSEETEGD